MNERSNSCTGGERPFVVMPPEGASADAIELHMLGFSTHEERRNIKAILVNKSPAK
jgi:hypothetical protein